MGQKAYCKQPAYNFFPEKKTPASHWWNRKRGRQWACAYIRYFESRAYSEIIINNSLCLKSEENSYHAHLVRFFSKKGWDKYREGRQKWEIWLEGILELSVSLDLWDQCLIFLLHWSRLGEDFKKSDTKKPKEKNEQTTMRHTKYSDRNTGIGL